MTGVNQHNQPIGRPVPGWTTRPKPPRAPIEGRFCRIEILDPQKHAADLFAANRLDVDGRNWTYLGYGPFDRLEDYRAWAESAAPAQSTRSGPAAASEAPRPIGTAWNDSRT